MHSFKPSCTMLLIWAIVQDTTGYRFNFSNLFLNNRSKIVTNRYRIEMHKTLQTGTLTLIFLFSSFLQIRAQNDVAWPEISNTVKPWARWWWMGNAVDKKNLRKALVDMDRAGLGGVEITPIYGVKGEEDNELDYLSPQWLEMLDFTLATADSLGMQVDMTLGTGWPYGGPQV